jgi:hypothetical protein
MPGLSDGCWQDCSITMISLSAQAGILHGGDIKISEISPCIVTNKINKSKEFDIKFNFSMTENIVLAFRNGQISVKKPVSGKF